MSDQGCPGHGHNSQWSGQEFSYFTSPGAPQPASSSTGSSPFVSQQTEQLPQVWGVFFCSQHCHRHIHTALRSQTDLRLFGGLAPAYLSTPCVVCVCSQLLPPRSCWELSSAFSWCRSSNPAAHTSGRMPEARALQVIPATQSETGRLSHLELTGLCQQHKASPAP